MPGRGGTHLTLSIVLDDIAQGAEPALAGVEIGWGQTLERLATLTAGSDPGAS